jgi:hypothetical protein
LQDGSYNGHLLCSKWSQLNVAITIVFPVCLLKKAIKRQHPNSDLLQTGSDVRERLHVSSVCHTVNTRQKTALNNNESASGPTLTDLQKIRV